MAELGVAEAMELLVVAGTVDFEIFAALGLRAALLGEGGAVREAISGCSDLTIVKRVFVECFEMWKKDEPKKRERNGRAGG